MDKKVLIGLALTLIIAVFIPAYWVNESARQSAALAQQKHEAMARGAKIFTTNCARCHGQAGEGLVGPALKGTQLDEEALEKVISRGRPDTIMPAWAAEDGGPLRKNQIRDLVTFIKNWDSALLESFVTEPKVPSSPAPTPSPAPAPTTPPADHAAEGKQLYLAKGCAACHGQNAEGSDIAPALPGHTKEQVLRQVRTPVGNMPSFGPEKISDDELEMIADYIAGLAPGSGGHGESIAMEDTLVIHHRMALSALDAGNMAEAEHHVRHILELVTDAEHKAQMGKVLENLQAGKIHDAEHAIENMLASEVDPGLTLENLHLQLTLAALEARDLEDAKHHLQHSIEMATGDEKGRAEEVLDLVEQGKLHDARHEVEELLAATGAGSAEPTPTATPAHTPAPAHAPAPNLAAEGKQLFSELQCIACHKINGEGGAVGPSLMGLFGSEEELATGEKVVVDHEYLEESIENPGAKVVKGYPAGVMPKLNLSQKQIDALIDFIKSLK
jgi:mono/diheme cytochrome c family protein